MAQVVLGLMLLTSTAGGKAAVTAAVLTREDGRPVDRPVPA